MKHMVKSDRVRLLMIRIMPLHCSALLKPAIFCTHVSSYKVDLVSCNDLDFERHHTDIRKGRRMTSEIGSQW